MKATYHDARAAILSLKGHGYDAFLAGGCVRDLLLHLNPNDYDVTTSATPDQVQQIFPHTVPVGASFGVVKVIVGEARELDVATFRADGAYTDNRHPDGVVYSRSIEEDVKRRDFTINAMLMDEDQKVLDFVGGQDDLENRTLRTVGNPVDRFGEDSLRMIRAIRFAVRYNLKIDPSTWLAIEQHAATIHNVSRERVTDELTKMFSYGATDIAFWLMIKSSLWQSWFSSGDFTYYPEYAINSMLGLAKMDVNDPFIMALAIILYEYHTSNKEHFLKRLVLTGDQKRDLDSVMSHAKALSVFMKEPLRDQRREMAWTDVHLAKKLIYCLSQSKVEEYYKGDECTVQSTLDRMDEVAAMGFPDALINGNDLIGMGYVSGPIFNKMLKLVQDEQLEERLTRQGVESFLAKRFPAAPRKLADGTIYDRMGPFKVMAVCKGCQRVMSFDVKYDEQGKALWSTVTNELDVRTYGGHYHYLACKHCGTRKARTGFVRANI